MLLTELISTILQILIFSLIPFVVYLIRYRKQSSFFRFIGLHSANTKANLYAVGVSLLFLGGGILAGLLDPELMETMRGPHTVIGKLRGAGWSTETMLTLFLMAGFKTSLSEEIFFRGFVAKRLMSWLGYQRGNLLQAFIFALVHVVLFVLLIGSSLRFSIFIFFLSGTAGYLVGYIKEKIGNGSIIPGWIAHGLGNTISYYLIGFVL
ncbi:MAG: CPBP family intramembrane glutamic endopeptidase [Bacteroidota bacterium]